MAKGDVKEESQFGFKDRAKAEETIELLKEHDIQYQRLTVRGLLGRAKRVLTLTKAEDKLKNIKAAMALFESWLEENGGSSSNKNSKVTDTDKVETVPGLGFKDKEAAEKTLKVLEGRDPDYQKLAVKGLIGGSKRVLSGTKNEDKIKAIKDGVKVLENFLDDFDRENRSKLNLAYLNSEILQKVPTPSDKLAAEFITSYTVKAKGNYKHLRTMFPAASDEISWDIIRNKNLKKIRDKIESSKAKLFDDNGKPTDDHMKLIAWAFSPQSEKVKSYFGKTEKSGSSKKRKSSSSSSSPSSASSSEETAHIVKKVKI